MFRIEDLRNRVMFTLALLAVYRAPLLALVPLVTIAISCSKNAACRKSR